MQAWLEHAVEGLHGTPDCCSCSGDFAAYAVGSSVHLLQLARCNEPVVLHPSAATASRGISTIQFGEAILGTTNTQSAEPQLLLLAAASNVISIWSVQEVLAAAAAADRPPTPLRLSTGGGAAAGAAEPVEAVAVEPSCSCLAVACGADVEVWSLCSLQQDMRLTGHEAAVTALSFNPQQPHLFVSAGEDRMFMVWDLDQGTCLFQSHILSAAPISCLAFDHSGARLTVGQTDGTLRFFDVSGLPRCLDAFTVDVPKELEKAAAGLQAIWEQGRAPGGQVKVVGTARQQLRQLTAATSTGAGGPWGESTAAGAQVGAPVFQADTCSCPLLFVQYVDAAAAGSSDGDQVSGGGGLLPSGQLLVVATSHAVLLLNAATYGLIKLFWVGAVAQELLEEQQQVAGPAAGGANSGSLLPQQLLEEVPTASCCSCAIQPASQQLVVVVGGLVRCEVSLVGIALGAVQSSAGRSGLRHPHTQLQQQLSVYQEGPLPSGCLLLPAGDTTSSSNSSGGVKTPKQQSTPTGPAAADTAAAVTPAVARTGRLRWGSNSSSSTPTPLPDNCTVAAGTDGPDVGNRSAKDITKNTTSSSNSSSSRVAPGGAASRSTITAAGTPKRVATSSGGSKAGALGTPGSRGSSSSSSGPKPAAVNKIKPGRQLQDQPVTFHRKVKSSGYGFVQPKVQLGCSKPAPVKVSAQPQVQQQLARHIAAGRQYPVDAPAPSCLDPGLELPGGDKVHSASVLSLCFSGDGGRLLTGSADYSARALQLPLSRCKGQGTGFSGHNGAVTAVSWSLDGSRCLTASMDRTACLWGLGQVTPLLCFSHLEQPPRPTAAPRAPTGISSTSRPTRQLPSPSGGSRLGPGLGSRSTSSPVQRGPVRAAAAGSRAISSLGASNSSSSSGGGGAATAGFKSEVVAAKFYYLDEFVVLVTGNQMLLYRYDISSACDTADDISRLRAPTLSSYSLVGCYSSHAQALLDVSVVNGFLSTTAIAASSNRSLEVIDTTCCKVVASLPEAHSRPAYRLVQPQPSAFASPGRDAYQLFASVAQDRCIKLWDLRCCEAVRTLTGVQNSQLRSGAIFSPCMQYLAAGSQDQAVMLWDLRSGGLLQRLRVGGSQGVADVAWHPLVPQLALGCMDGNVRFVSSEAA